MAYGTTNLWRLAVSNRVKNSTNPKRTAERQAGFRSHCKKIMFPNRVPKNLGFKVLQRFLFIYIYVYTIYNIKSILYSISYIIYILEYSIIYYISYIIYHIIYSGLYIYIIIHIYICLIFHTFPAKFGWWSHTTTPKKNNNMVFRHVVKQGPFCSYRVVPQFVSQVGL
jgi:hypothetical protein